MGPNCTSAATCRKKICLNIKKKVSLLKIFSLVRATGEGEVSALEKNDTE